MARFFVHIVDRDGRAVDNEGFDVFDIDALRLLLRETAAEIVHQEILDGHPIVDLTFHVEDENRLEIMVLPVQVRISY